MSLEAPAPKSRSSFRWLVVLLVLLIGGYTAGWFYAAKRVESEVARTVARLGDSGVRLDCGNQKVSGYPLRLGLSCDSLQYHDPKRYIRLATGAVRSGVDIYNPLVAVTDVEGPLQVTEAPDFPDLRFTTTWSSLRLSARLARPVPKSISMVAQDVATTMRSLEDDGGKNLFAAKLLETQMSPNAADLDYVAKFTGLSIDPDVMGGRDLPAFDGAGDIKIANGVALLADRPRSLKGLSFELRNVALSSGEGRMAVSGPLSIDNDGLLDAKLKVTMSNPMAIAEMLKTAFPERASDIDKAMFGLAFLGKELSLPLNITKGQAALGIIPLGDVPALDKPF